MLNHIIKNNIVHWKNVNYNPQDLKYSIQELLNFEFFAHWVVGFIVAEGSFGFKSRGDAFFQVKQKGIENYNLIKAISVLIVDREPNIKADYTNSYQLSLT